MSRIFSQYAYGPGPRETCYWDTTCDLPTYPKLDSDLQVDVAVIGAGFTGLNAALRLADQGLSVAVLDAEQPGWGASGRNGGFCCLGGAKASDDWLDRQFGKSARLAWRGTEVAAVQHVAELIASADVDQHSVGETWLAHRPKDLRSFGKDVLAVRENYGVDAVPFSREALEAEGLSAGFHGGMTTPIGFALNPRKYIRLLLDKLAGRSVSIYSQSPAQTLKQHNSSWSVVSDRGQIRAQNVIIATNGYSSEHFPPWLAGRFMPVQSNVAVTRELTEDEIARQNWSSLQMCYDSRSLLHYFRLMPNNRMLFGLRGGLLSGARAQARAKRRLERDFRRMFPQWGDVEFTHSWSGMVCMSRNFVPFAGRVPGHSSLYAALCYHGNGVAMGSYLGRYIGDLASDATEKDAVPLVSKPLLRFPLGRWRRMAMPFVYAGLAITDR